MNTTTQQVREMTTAELDRLLRLANKVEDAKDFTQSCKALEQLSDFQERLMDKGVPVQAINKAMGRN